MKYFIIINLYAGGDNARRAWPDIQKQLATSSISYKALYTEYPNHAVELAKQILGKVDASGQKDAVIMLPAAMGPFMKRYWAVNAITKPILITIKYQLHFCQLVQATILPVASKPRYTGKKL